MAYRLMLEGLGFAAQVLCWQSKGSADAMKLEQSSCTEELVRFLKRDYANNLYFFTYIDEHCGGLPDPGARVLVARRGDDVVLAVLMSPTHCCISASDVGLIGSAARQLTSVESTHILGRHDYTLEFLDTINGPGRKRKWCTFCKLNPQHLSDQERPQSVRASPSDLPELVRFYQDNSMLMNCETRLPSIMSSGSVQVARRDSNIVSCALTTTETHDMAMVGAVFTDERFRNQGFARDCTTSLCRRLVKEGKKVYLFYETDNPVLAQMYRSMGFDTIGSWVVATIA